MAKVKKTIKRWVDRKATPEETVKEFLAGWCDCKTRREYVDDHAGTPKKVTITIEVDDGQE